MTNFKVSVIIPVYNAELYIKKAVESALSLKETGEVIIIEDGSKDASLKICKELKKEYNKVILLTHEKNQNLGVSASRNLGIQYASFDFIAFLDADDYYLPNRFLRDKELLINNENIDGSYNALGIKYYTENGKLKFLKSGYKYQEFYTISHHISPEELFLVLFNCHPTCKGEFHGDTITVRKSVFKKVGMFNTNLKLKEGNHLWRRMAAICTLAGGNISEPVAIRGVHDTNTMVNHSIQPDSSEIWWKDLHNWLRENNVKKEFKECFEKSYLYYKIKQYRKSQKILAFVKYYLKRPKLIFKSVIFDYHFFEVFGRNWFTLHAVSFKNRLISNKINT